MINIAIIGAGLAGLTVAKLLQSKANITIFEKSRGVGGRMATRYAEKWEFDHGAPFFTAKSSKFKEFLQPLLTENIVAKWNIKLAKDGLHSKVYSPNLANDYFVGSSRMNVIGKYLAKNLDIRLETKIVKLEKISRKWKLTDDKSQEYPDFDFVITATPPFQAADILPSNCPYATDIRKVEMLPTFAIMLGFNDKVMQSENWDMTYIQDSAIDLVVANHNKPFRKADQSFVVFTNHHWAKKNIDMNKDEVGKSIITELENIFNEKIQPSITQVHRWLYAKTEPRDVAKSFFIDKDSHLISCGDWCIGNNVEDAFQSGFDVFKYLTKL